MTLDDIFYKVLSNITGGLVHDFATAIIGLIFLLIIMAGLDLLKDLFEVSMVNRGAEKNWHAARHYLGFRDLSEQGSMEYDYYNALYKAHLSKSVSMSAKTGRTFAEDPPPGLSDMGISSNLFEDEEETGLVKSDTIHL